MVTSSYQDVLGRNSRPSSRARSAGDVLELELAERSQGFLNESGLLSMTSQGAHQAVGTGLGVGEGCVDRLGLADQRRQAAVWAGLRRDGVGLGRDDRVDRVAHDRGAP